MEDKIGFLLSYDKKVLSKNIKTEGCVLYGEFN